MDGQLELDHHKHTEGRPLLEPVLEGDLWGNNRKTFRFGTQTFSVRRLEHCMKQQNAHSHKSLGNIYPNGASWCSRD
jgi:hypothetical protein